MLCVHLYITAGKMLTQNKFKSNLKFNPMKKQLLIAALLCIAAVSARAQSLALPYTSGFDTPQEQAGWQQYRTGVQPSYDWSIGAPAASAPNALHHDYNVGGGSGDILTDWYVSPPLNCTGGPVDISLKVMTGGFSTPFPDNCEIWFSTYDPNPANGNFILVGNLSYMLPQYQWLDTVMNFYPASDSTYIAFRYKTTGAAWSTYGIDNVNVSFVTGISENAGNSIVQRVYPTPFNFTTTIDLNMAVTNATLTIYDVCGKQVKTMDNVSGNKIHIEKGDMYSGVYFFRIAESGKSIASGKVVVAD
jgi:hypothetical protein